ncbi:MAG: periplasmic divalent cation tolerance protein [Cognaticolwellia sp.]|jgi:periplasmic divalent cation tolerance protein
MIVMLCNFPPKAANAAAKALVEEQLAACVNVLSPVTSIYRWKGETCTEQEVPLLIKAPRRLADRLQARIHELHPYDVPEILALSLDESASSSAYVAWVRALGSA